MDGGREQKRTGTAALPSSKQGQNGAKKAGKVISKPKAMQIMATLLAISNEEKGTYLERLEDTVGKMRKLKSEADAIKEMGGCQSEGLDEMGNASTEKRSQQKCV